MDQATAAPAVPETKTPQNGANPPSGETKPLAPETKPPEPKADSLEAELEAKWGEDWKSLKADMRTRIIASEKKSRDADKQYQQVASFKKQYDLSNQQMTQILSAIKADPIAVLKNPALGHDIKALTLNLLKESQSSPEIRRAAEEIVWQAYQEERMTPEQREARINASKLKQYEEQERQRSEAQKAEQQRQLNAAMMKKLDETFTQALKDAELPKNTWSIQRMVHWYKANRRAGIPIDMKAIADSVRNDYESAAVAYFRGKMESRPKESRLEGVDAAVVKLIREADLHTLRAKGLAPKPGPKPTNGAPQKKEGDKKVSWDDWLNSREERLGRK